MLKHFVEMLTEKISIETSNSTDEILARLKHEGSLADFERLEKKTAAGKCRFSVVSFFCIVSPHLKRSLVPLNLCVLCHVPSTKSQLICINKAQFRLVFFDNSGHCA